MDELVTNGWPRLSSTESTRKRRKRLGTWTGRGRQAATPTQHRLQQVENAVVPTQREALPLAAIAELLQHETNHNPADYEWFQPFGPGASSPWVRRLKMRRRENEDGDEEDVDESRRIDDLDDLGAPHMYYDMHGRLVKRFVTDNTRPRYLGT